MAIRAARVRVRVGAGAGAGAVSVLPVVEPQGVTALAQCRVQLPVAQHGLASHVWPRRRCWRWRVRAVRSGSTRARARVSIGGYAALDPRVASASVRALPPPPAALPLS